jgi:hypothetical protein
MCTRDCQQLQEFVNQGCTQLKIQVSVDKLDIPNVLMQCETHNYNESQPCEIFISLQVSIETFYSHITIHLCCSGIDTL